MPGQQQTSSSFTANACTWIKTLTQMSCRTWHQGTCCFPKPGTALIWFVLPRYAPNGLQSCLLQFSSHGCCIADRPGTLCIDVPVSALCLLPLYIHTKRRICSFTLFDCAFISIMTPTPASPFVPLPLPLPVVDIPNLFKRSLSGPTTSAECGVYTVRLEGAVNQAQCVVNGQAGPIPFAE